MAESEAGPSHMFNLLDKVKQPLDGLLAKIGLVKKKTEEEEKVG
jgi:hypothetical protein